VPLINPALNVLRGPRQVVRVMYQMVQVWPPFRQFCDYFERPNGPLGPFWMPGIIRRTGGYDECTTIEPYIVSGHVEGDEDAVPTLMATTTEIIFADTFDRDEGPLGPNWIPVAAALDGQVRPMPVIEFARASDPEQGATVDQARYALVAMLMTGDYTVDLRINSVAGVNNTISVLVGFDGTLGSGLEFGFIAANDDEPWMGSLFVVEWFHGGVVGSGSFGAPIANPAALRVEKQNSTFRLSYAPVTDTAAFVFVGAYDRPGFNGQHVGMRIEWHRDAGFKPYIDALTVSRKAPIGHLLNDVMTTETYIGDQFVEIVTDNVHQGAGGTLVQGPFILYCQANTKNLCCTAVWCEYLIAGGQGELWAYVFQQDALGQVHNPPPGTGQLATGTLEGFAFPGDPIAKLRLEVGRAGHLRLLASDDEFIARVVMDRQVPALSGDRVGFAFMWRGGGADCWTDDFERVEIGPGWVLAPYTAYATFYGGATSHDVGPFFLSTGAAVTTVDGPMSSMRWHAAHADDQSIEIEIDDCQGNNGYAVLFTHANATDAACVALEVNFYDRSFPWTPPATVDDELYLDLVHFPGNAEWYRIADVTLPYPASEPATFRLESDADGTQRVYVNDTLVLTAVDSAQPDGPYVGMAMRALSHLEAYTSARILSASGCSGAPSAPGDDGGSSYHILEVCGGLTEIPEPVSNGDLLFVLDWATEPFDLDFHMSGPSGPAGVDPGNDAFPVSSRFHVNFYQEWPVFHGLLDFDDTTSFGPEYIMILGANAAPQLPPPSGRPDGNESPPVLYRSNGFVPGDYAVWVNRYAGAPGSSFATSDATVRVYRSRRPLTELVFDADDRLVVDLADWTLADTFHIGDATGDLTATTFHGPNWHVCDAHATRESIAVTSVQRIEPGDYNTHVLPD